MPSAGQVDDLHATWLTTELGRRIRVLHQTLFFSITSTITEPGPAGRNCSIAIEFSTSSGAGKRALGRSSVLLLSLWRCQASPVPDSSRRRHLNFSRNKIADLG